MGQVLKNHPGVAAVRCLAPAGGAQVTVIAVLAVLACAVSVQTASATVLAAEDFESYSPSTNASSVNIGAYNWVYGTKDGDGNIVGKLNGGTGWGQGWANGGTDVYGGTVGNTATSPNFIISGGGPSGNFYDGANASSDNSGYGKARAFASTIGNSWQSSALSFGANGAKVGLFSTAGFWSFNITSNGGNYGLEEYNGSAQTVNLIKAVSTNAASPDLAITKISGSLVSLWINPANTSSEETLGTPDVTITVGHAGLTSYTIAGKVRVDNIRVGSTLADVIPTGATTPYQTWADAYAGSGTPGEDFNNDGVSNGIAYFMGMNGLATNPGVVNGKVTWPHVGTVASWEVQVSNDLVTWDPAASGDIDTTSSPGNVIYTLPTGAPQKFCRLMVVP